MTLLNDIFSGSRPPRSRRLLTSLAIVAFGGLTGCAQFSADGGMNKVQQLVGDELGKDTVRIRSEEDAENAYHRVKDLLQAPLTAETAVQVALLNNKGLQAAFSDLAITEAQGVESSLPVSPTISLTRLVATRELEIERTILVNVLSLLTVPRRRELARGKFAQAKLKATEAAFKLAAETRRAYYRAVAAAQLVKFLEEAKLAAEAGSDLAKKLGETGALSKLNQAREHAFYADLGAQLATAKLNRGMERERLTRLLGLWGRDINYRLPGVLPKLPGKVKRLPQIEADAIERRIDLKIARMELDYLAKSLGLTKRTRFINVLEVRGMRNTEWAPALEKTPAGDVEEEREKTKWRGIELEFQIPIYDFGRARTRLAEEQYMQAVHRLAELAVNIRSEVRVAYHGYRGTYDIAMHYQKEVLPLRKIITDETLLRYNAMISDVADLLIDQRARVASNIAAIDAQRAFFLAKADLGFAIIGGGSGAAGGTTQVAVAAESGGGGH